MRDLSEKEFNMIRSYVKAKYGINLRDEKKSLVYSRLRAVLQEKGFNDFTQYFEYVINDRTGEARMTFIDRITTNHTFFMREPDHFYYFRDTVLPHIAARHGAAKDLRIWCAGCSTGEEPYTLQMMIQDYFADKPGWNTEILATDISTKVLSKAMEGVYSNDSIQPVPEHWKRKYFSPWNAANSMVSAQVKDRITFRRHNLMEDRFLFSKQFQVIFCRNVMIYFDVETRTRLVEKFYAVTEPGGYLFTGHSESLNQNDVKFQYIQPALYRKI